MTTDTNASKANVSKIPEMPTAAVQVSDDRTANDMVPLAFDSIESVTLTLHYTWRPMSEDDFNNDAAVLLTATCNGETISVASHEVDDCRAWKRMKKILSEEMREKHNRLVGRLFE